MSYSTATKHRHIDLSKKANSATSIIKSNLDQLNTCKTCGELYSVLLTAFNNNNLNTQWTRTFLYKLSIIPDRNVVKGLQYCYNAMLSGMNLGVK